MTSIPDLIARLREIHDHDWRVSFLAHTSDTAGEAADLLTRLTAPGDEGLETTEDDLIALEELERGESLKGVDIANIDRLLRDFDLLRAKLRAERERADMLDYAYDETFAHWSAEKDRAASYEAALKAVAFGSYSNVSVDSQGSLELAQIAARMQEIARAALNPEPKP
jgi:hypothetical protein